VDTGSDMFVVVHVWCTSDLDRFDRNSDLAVESGMFEIMFDDTEYEDEVTVLILLGVVYVNEE